MKMNRMGTILMLFGIMLILAGLTTSFSLTIVGSGQFDNCDALTSATSFWRSGTPSATISVDTAFKVEGTGSIKTNTSALAWSLYIEKWIYYVPNNVLDFSQNPKLTFNFYTTNTKDSVGNPVSVFFTATGEADWARWDITVQIIANQWKTVIIDLASVDMNGYRLNLTSVIGLAISFNDGGIAQLPIMSTWIDDIQTSVSIEPPPPPPPPPPVGETFTLTINSSPNGTTIPSAGMQTVNSGSTVTLTAIPNANYKFDCWEVNGQINTSNPLSLTITANTVVTPIFTLQTEPPPPPPPPTTEEKPFPLNMMLMTLGAVTMLTGIAMTFKRNKNA